MVHTIQRYKNLHNLKPTENAIQISLKKKRITDVEVK